MAQVHIKNVGKTYPNGFVAIEDIELDIGDGEFLVLVGPSGCGKSTLLRLVAGLETITTGEVHINDRQVNKLEPAERDIAMVFQNYALYPHMSVYNNMAYGLKNKKMPRDLIEERVQAAAQMLELEGLLSRKPRQLSGGQRQRVAMGRAIVREPQVFLFDEPLSNLDAKLRVQMRMEIKRLQRKLGTTTIYVTHDQTEAMTMADRLVVINDGAAEQVGTPTELYDKPATRFVAGFIGSPAMNFLEVQCLENNHVQMSNGVELPFSAPSPTGQRALALGIRPEDIILSESGVLTATVELVEPLGHETLVHCKLDAGNNLITVKHPGKTRLDLGARTGLDFARESIHWFDGKTHQRISE